MSEPRTDPLALLEHAWREIVPGLDLEIADDDDMLRWQRHSGRSDFEVRCEYLSIGHEIARVTLQALAACGKELARCASLLDCGCGHGRGTRFLVRELPSGRITGCDPVASALDFQAARFGVRGVRSLAELPAERFEVATAIGLFSNLPEPLALEVLSGLVERLAPDGVLLVATDSPPEVSVFEYRRESESSVLGPEVYGAARFPPQWFEEHVRALPGVGSVRRAARAFVGLHDVWVVARDARLQRRPLAILPPPHVEVDRARLDRQGGLRVAGWALDGERRPCAQVEVLTRGGVHAARPGSRPDVAAHFGAPQAADSGFELQHDCGPRDWPRQLLVRARAADGSAGLRAARVLGAERVRTPDAAEAALLARQQRARALLAYGGLFSPAEAEVHEDGLYPQLATRAQGCRIWDAAGREYLDWFLGWGPMLLGHAHPEVAQAIEQQLHQAPALSLMHELEIEVAERLARTIPCAERVAFGKNGSDVTLAAARVARAFTGRDLVATCGYHGFHDWSMAQFPWCAGIPAALRADARSFPFNDLAALERLLEAEPGRFAALILEPASNALPEPGFLEGVRRLAHAHGALLVFDEMVTGFRLARGGAQEAYGVLPDLACFGKALANGLPLSALVGRSEVLEALPRVGFGLTFRGELLSLAAARCCLDIFAREPVAEHVGRIGEELRERFGAAARARGLALELRGFAGRMTLEAAPTNGLSSAGQRAYLVQECLKLGLLTNGTLLPCFAHDAAALEATLAILGQALDRLRRVVDAGTLEPFLDGPVQPHFYAG